MCAGNAPTMHMCLLRQTCILVPVSRHSTGWHESVEQARGLPPLTKAMLTRVECNAHRKTMGPHVQHLFTTDRTPSTLQDQESFESDWQVIRKYSSL